MKRIIHDLDVKAQRNQVYAALTTHHGLTGWWTTDVTADTTVGGRIDFRFGTNFNTQMRITALQPGRRVEWRVPEETRRGSIIRSPSILASEMD